MQGNPWFRRNSTENTPFTLESLDSLYLLWVLRQFKSYIAYRRYPLLYLEEYKIAATVGNLENENKNWQIVRKKFKN